MRDSDRLFEALNPSQRAAAEYGTPGLPAEPPGPLLIIAGAGTGKTSTLAHRVAALLVRGADPRRVLLLTFTRRAAETMTRRAARIAAQATAGGAAPARIEWSGTFHAVANRLLRRHAESVGLDPAFTVLDRSDAADVMNLARHELGLSRRATRFPTKATCLAIYSHAVNAGAGLERTLERAFPAYRDWTEELKGLFQTYVDAKQRQHLLDYDDLLLYWFHLMRDEQAAGQVRRRFDHVLVDEYQDTNALQAGILLGLKPDGRGLTVVGDDAQAIYGFRAASVRNILDFPEQFTPAADVITLEQNYRSTPPILDAANAVIALAPEGFAKRLFSTRRSEQRPLLVAVRDEQAEADHVADRVLEHREAGIALRRQAVLMRTAHHSDLLEVELGRRNIPFVKYGGLKFLEAAHVKDLLCVLRWAENPRDDVAAFRLLQLLPGIGPGSARRLLGELEAAGGDLATLATFPVPAAARADWLPFCELMTTLRRSEHWAGQLESVRRWYEPHLERLHDLPHLRLADLEQLERLAAGYDTRERFLTDLTLDPPGGMGGEAGDPLLDDDYLVLSTIHSAKGQEWDVVYVLHVVDGCIPSDMATGSPEEIEEERRLLYVAMTRARDWLYLLQPHRFHTGANPDSDRYVHAPPSRFIPPGVAERFERVAAGRSEVASIVGTAAGPTGDAARRIREMWR
jgi:DNA helicase-2/ATP-dependent DNA helicase PcrA